MFKLYIIIFYLNGDWGLGIGDLGSGGWGWGRSPIPKNPIPNPQSPQKLLKNLFFK